MSELDLLVSREVFHELYIEAPPYSTDITAAWEVVKKMDADGFFWAIADDEVYFAQGNPDDPNYRFGGVASSAFTDKPLAICRAALKAVASTAGGE